MIDSYLMGMGALWGLTFCLAIMMVGRVFVGPPRISLEPYWVFVMLFIGLCALIGGLS